MSVDVSHSSNDISTSSITVCFTPFDPASRLTLVFFLPPPRHPTTTCFLTLLTRGRGGSLASMTPAVLFDRENVIRHGFNAVSANTPCIPSNGPLRSRSFGKFEVVAHSSMLRD